MTKQQGAETMNNESVPARPADTLAISLTKFTDKLIERRGVEEANLLFGGQIDPAKTALNARTNVIGVGDKASDFLLPTTDGEMWRLREYFAQTKCSSLVVVFYRGTWCTYCNIYLRGLLDVQPQLLEAGAHLIAVSPEAAPADNADTVRPSFPVLVDHGGEIAEQFGLTFEMDDVAKNLLKKFGIDLAKRNADGKWMLPVPGTFVIDRSCNIAYAHVDADYRNRPEPQEIVAICQSLRR
jgi:peroxiredoxin